MHKSVPCYTIQALAWLCIIIQSNSLVYRASRDTRPVLLEHSCNLITTPHHSSILYDKEITLYGGVINEDAQKAC